MTLSMCPLHDLSTLSDLPKAPFAEMHQNQPPEVRDLAWLVVPLAPPVPGAQKLKMGIFA
jgi:hypothetical protein